MKPNYKTSEFWFTAVTFIFSGLFLTGVLTDYDQKEDLISDISHGVESVFLIGGQLAVLYRYINSRNKQKIEHEKTRRSRNRKAEEEIEDYVGVDKVLIEVNINTAKIGELIQLPHIGTSLAGKIIEYREENGEFERVSDIRKVSGIGKSIYKDIERYISI